MLWDSLCISVLLFQKMLFSALIRWVDISSGSLHFLNLSGWFFLLLKDFLFHILILSALKSLLTGCLKFLFFYLPHLEDLLFALFSYRNLLTLPPGKAALFCHKWYFAILSFSDYIFDIVPVILRKICGSGSGPFLLLILTLLIPGKCLQ